MSLRVHLPHLGLRTVAEDRLHPGHYLWLDMLGWHDCAVMEDALIRVAIRYRKRGEVT